ncbi:SGNH/GDSL hydrolase family protein [Niallia circulans]|uniref:SGNH/GDSL hydrolase family protein n=1 Tax=Niallia circulans TaxID=1397 RepID=UPI0022A9A06D|nr:SGNH/GDSL hydrolase family protein [Niallia circulans]
MCFGDSITAGRETRNEPVLTAMLADTIDHYEIINAGINGNNTVDALNRIEADVIQKQPDLVTILFGANDAAFHKMIDLPTYRKNMRRIVQLIGPDKAILITPAPVDETLQFARTNEVLARYANAVKEVATETGAYFIDFYTEMLSLEDYQKKLKGIHNDGLHFGEEGYAILVDLLVKKLHEI